MTSPQAQQSSRLAFELRGCNMTRLGDIVLYGLYMHICFFMRLVRNQSIVSSLNRCTDLWCHWRKLKQQRPPGSSPHREGSPLCCSTVCQRGGCGIVDTGNKWHGRFCLGPRWQVRSAPPLFCKSHTDLTTKHNIISMLSKPWHVRMKSNRGKKMNVSGL